MSEEDTSSDDNVKPPMIDPDKINKEEDLMWGHTKAGNKPLDLLSDYLPEKEDYAAKTVLQPGQVHLLTAFEMTPVFYPEIAEFSEDIQKWVDSFEKRKTSVQGLSRDEFLQILVSFSGGSVDKEERKKLIDKVLETNFGEGSDD